jgi:hypothetical protein
MQLIQTFSAESWSQLKCASHRMVFWRVVSCTCHVMKIHTRSGDTLPYLVYSWCLNGNNWWSPRGTSWTTGLTLRSLKFTLFNRRIASTAGWTGDSVTGYVVYARGASAHFTHNADTFLGSAQIRWIEWNNCFVVSTITWSKTSGTSEGYNYSEIVYTWHRLWHLIQAAVTTWQMPGIFHCTSSLC